MKEFVEGSQNVAHTVALCRPGVISAYPITPQTHIVEDLAQIVADGNLKSQFVNVESEHSAASVVLGASATGVRTYTATSSQGLLYMVEVLFNIAGLRLPIILTCANRAVSAPINIWNDQQDVMTIRDSGWVLLFAETQQEVADLHTQAYRIAEDHNIMLPVMINIDGYALTHGLEVVDMQTQEQVDKFLPSYQPLYKLDPDKPITMGVLADPDFYLETRYAIQETQKDVLKLIPQVSAEFKKVFGRDGVGLVEEYKTKDAEKVIVSMGSVCGTIREAIDELRAKGKKVGLLKVICYRPFPTAAIYQALKGIKQVAILDRSISLGSFGPLYTEIKSIFQDKKVSPKISGFVAGLGGRDITKDSIKYVFKTMSAKDVSCEFVDLKPELLKEKFE